MHLTPSLTPAAMRRWVLMTDESKEIILARMWCMHCDACGNLRDTRGELHPSGDIILHAVCGACGGRICRVIETGESMGRADQFP